MSLSGPLNRSNAILAPPHPLNCHRTPSAIGSAIWAALSRPISHPHTGRSSQPPRSKPLKRLNSAIVAQKTISVKNPSKTSAKQKHDAGRDSQPHPRQRLNSHRVLQGAPPRGRQLYFTFPSAPDPLFKASKAPFLTLKVATPSGAPHQAPFETLKRRGRLSSCLAQLS